MDFITEFDFVINGEEETIYAEVEAVTLYLYGHNEDGSVDYDYDFYWDNIGEIYYIDGDGNHVKPVIDEELERVAMRECESYIQEYVNETY